MRHDRKRRPTSHRWLHGPLTGALALAIAACLGADDAAARSVDDYIESANEYRAEGKNRASAIELKNAIQEDPNDATPRRMLGEVYLLLGDVLRAEKELRRARELGAPYDDWAVPLGQVWLQMGQPQTLLDELTPDRAESEGVAAKVLALRGGAWRLARDVNASADAYREALALRPNEVSALVGLARLALHEGQRAEADQWFANAKNAAPGDYETIALQGDLHFIDRKFAEATDAYRQLTALRPHNPFVSVPLARALLADEKVDEALATVESILKVVPNLPQALYIRASAAYAQQDYETAVADAERILKTVPTDLASKLLAAAASYALGNNEQALQYADEFLARAPGHEMALRLKGATLTRLGQHEEAVRILEQVADTDNATVLAMIGAAALRGRDLATGREYFERYAALNPDSAGALAQLGVVKLGQGEIEAGIEDLERALQLDPDFDRALIALFRAHMQGQRYGDAIALGERVVTQQPDKILGDIMIGIARFADGDHAAARAAMERALEKEPTSTIARTNLARIANAMGDRDEAARQLRAIIEDDPDNIVTLLNLARLSAQSGANEAAFEWVERAKAVQPGAQAPRYYEAQLLISTGDALRAVAIAQELATELPENVPVLRLLAQAQMAAGQSESATTTLRSLVRLRPDDAGARYMLATIHRDAGNEAAFMAGLQDVLAQDPAHLPATVDLARIHVRAGKPESAKEMVEAALARAPESAALLEVAGQMYELLGDGGRAIEVYRTLAETNPDVAASHFLLARALGRAGLGAEALSEINKTIELDETHLGARIIRARAALAQRRQADAQADITYLTAQAPDNPEVLDLEGALLLANGEHELALRAFERAYVGLPSSGRASQLARTQWVLGRREDGMNTLGSWLQSHPDDHARRKDLADFTLATGRFDQASAHYTRLIEANPGNAGLRNNLAWALWKNGDNAGALREAEKATELQPGDPRIQDTLGAILLSNGESDRALTVLREAAAGAPRHPTIQFHFAQALAQTGAGEEARKLLETVLAENGAFDERAEAEALLASLSE